MYLNVIFIHVFARTIEAPVRVAVVVERKMLLSTTSDEEALIRAMQCFFIFNIEYPIEVGATLEYIQS